MPGSLSFPSTKPTESGNPQPNHTHTQLENRNERRVKKLRGLISSGATSNCPHSVSNSLEAAHCSETHLCPPRDLKDFLPHLPALKRGQWGIRDLEAGQKVLCKGCPLGKTIDKEDLPSGEVIHGHFEIQMVDPILWETKAKLGEPHFKNQPFEGQEKVRLETK